MVSGRRRLSWYVNIEKRMFLPPDDVVRQLRGQLAPEAVGQVVAGRHGGDVVGERCSIVTFAAVFAMDGTSVTAVAPLPMITTCLPS